MFRKNVAALIQWKGLYVGCCRADKKSVWQCVQGGIERQDLTPEHALARELHEELGLEPSAYSILKRSRFWRRYFFPPEILEKNRFEGHIGQQQLWFLLEIQDLNSICLENSVGEFQAVQTFTLNELLSLYPYWKKAPLYDFCRELGKIGEQK